MGAVATLLFESFKLSADSITACVLLVLYTCKCDPKGYLHFKSSSYCLHCALGAAKTWLNHSQICACVHTHTDHWSCCCWSANVPLILLLLCRHCYTESFHSLWHSSIIAVWQNFTSEIFTGTKQNTNTVCRNNLHTYYWKHYSNHRWVSCSL